MNGPGFGRQQEPKERIGLDDSPKSAILKMSDGNPGALRVCLELLDAAPRIDKLDMFGGIGPILNLDTAGIYGDDIWGLYKDHCNQDIENVVTALRGFQLGFVNTRELKTGAFDIDALRVAVVESLGPENFVLKGVDAPSSEDVDLG